MRQRNLRNQSELARIAGIPASTVNRILKREAYSPSWETLHRLASALSVSPVWLATGETAVRPSHGVAERDPVVPVALPLPGWQLEALRILEALDETDRKKVMAVLRLLDTRHTDQVSS